MRKIAATLAATAMVVATATLPAEAAPKRVKACKYEDSVSCVWDARHIGDGKGRSFRAFKNGKIRFISHKRAHTLIYGR